ncbi:hypothetical protein IE81DRAFT_321118 [Ceraceosorus guamensis]|uniref:Uncharacterized protein n=1 Tax=Ceraceosorus guamensis TaxID=1522189 RepID=A0A316WA40_9BASI|nr:hypothetical protein IE81DRAFT_321118 [Ceraceosorus guamensis]PWN44505.1 hypothetical protein IE81DRAFT_321118 [Ceraceosorus guamensis]
MTEATTNDLPTSPPTSPGDDAAARRAARKARILGSGTDRLARITKTGRGDEASTLYPPTSPSSSSSRGIAPNLSAEADEHPDPEEIDLAQLARLQAGEGGAMSVNPFASPRAGQTHLNDAQSPGQGQQGLPPGFPQLPAGMELPPGMADMFAQFQAAMAGGGGPPGSSGEAGAQTSTPPVAPSGSRTVERIFGLTRVLIFAAFGAYLVAPLLHAHRAVLAGEGEAHHVNGGALLHWARLGYERPSPWDAGTFGLEELGLGGIPVFYLFLTLEIGLQSARIMLMRHRPPPPSLLQRFSPLLPPALSSILLTGSQYLTLLNAFINDLAVVIFVMGVGILWAGWRVGYDPFGQAGDALASIGSAIDPNQFADTASPAGVAASARGAVGGIPALAKAAAENVLGSQPPFEPPYQGAL